MSSTIAARGIHGVGSALAALVACAGWASAAEGQRYWDLMADVESVQTPRVTENSSDPSGVNTTYKWRGMKDNGVEGRMGVLTGTSTPLRPYGFEWGVDLFAERYTITPSSFEVGGANFANVLPNEHRYYAAGADLCAGWQYGTASKDAMHGIVEIVPFIGAGLNHASSDITFGGGVNHPASAYGTEFQYGVKLGLYVTERRWIAGVLLVYQGSYGKVSMSNSGFSSDMTLKQQSFGFGAALGYRF